MSLVGLVFAKLTGPCTGAGNREHRYAAQETMWVVTWR